MNKLQNWIFFIFIVGMLLVAGGCTKKDEVFVVETGETEEHTDSIKEDLENTKEKPDATSEVDTSETIEESSTQSEFIYVYVSGAVVYPGVYHMEPKARIFEAIKIAGGLRSDAYEMALNQAEILQDGQQIMIPTKEEWEAGLVPSGTESAQKEDGLVDINTADAVTLCTLPGVGETRAETIISYRTENGAFSTIEDIQNVPGIKSGLFGKIKDKIKVR